MIDACNRDITYLRLSVTDRCNLRCAYCMPAGDPAKKFCSDTLSVDEIECVVQAAAACGIDKVRLTGGEPLVRSDILEICRRIAAIPKIREICMTTNGTLLPKLADGLKAAGVHRLNISLDSLDEERYRQITRGGSLRQVLAGIRAARAAGFERIKINTVLTDGLTDREIFDLIDMTRTEAIDVRFIELMPIGECAPWAMAHFTSNRRILDTIPQLQPAGFGGVARQFRLPGHIGKVGLISPLSDHFCPACNRIRVTSDGRIKPCLHSATEIALKGLSRPAMEAAIRQAILVKPDRHHLANTMCSESLRNMHAIGG